MFCDYLLEFAALARAGTFTTAAEQLGMSHACLRRHMKALESQLGAVLLNRSEAGVSLTDVGKVVYARTNDIESIVSDITRSIADQRQTASIVIYGVDSYPAHIVALRELCAATTWRGMRVNPTFQATADLIRSWNAGDAGAQPGSRLVFLPANAELRKQFRSDWMFADAPDLELVAVMESSNPLSAKDALNVEDLNGSLIIYSDSDRHMMAYTFWTCLSAQLRELGVRFQSEASPFHNDSDWFVDLRRGMVIVPRVYYIVDTVRSLGKAVVPIEGLRMSQMCAYPDGDELAAYVASVVSGR